MLSLMPPFFSSQPPMLFAFCIDYFHTPPPPLIIDIFDDAADYFMPLPIIAISPAATIIVFATPFSAAIFQLAAIRHFHAIFGIDTPLLPLFTLLLLCHDFFDIASSADTGCCRLR
jgi:hypothetical protein